MAIRVLDDPASVAHHLALLGHVHLFFYVATAPSPGAFDHLLSLWAHVVPPAGASGDSCAFLAAAHTSLVHLAHILLIDQASQWILISLSTIVLFARIALRLSIQKGRFLDTDFLMCAAWLCAVVTTSFDIKLAQLDALRPGISLNLEGYTGSPQQKSLSLKVSDLDWSAEREEHVTNPDLNAVGVDQPYTLVYDILPV
ncbi:hypothetical protein ACJZ2D_000461 [Fusarium nematophilum]